MYDLSAFECSVRALSDSLRDYSNTAELEDLELWMGRVSEAIEQLEEIASIPYLSRAEKQKVQTLAAHFITFRQRIRILILRKQHEQREVIGGELQHSPQPAPLNHPSVAWDDLESAFARRIRSGVISNLGHLDITSFMEDSKSLFVQEVRRFWKSILH